MYPILMNIKNCQCTVIGGGKVALRKTTSLLANGAIVRVIGPKIIPEITVLPVITILKEYKAELLDGSFLVIATTENKELNRSIVKACREKNILVSSATDSKESDFILPATVSCGDIGFTVSTNGGFPKLAVKICRQLAKDYAVYGEICSILSRYRNYIIETVKDNQKKESLLNSLVSDEILNIALEQGTAEFEKHILRIINGGLL